MPAVSNDSRQSCYFIEFIQGLLYSPRPTRPSVSLVLTNSNLPLVVVNSTPFCWSLALTIPSVAPTSFVPSQIFFPFSAIDAVVAGWPAVVGLGTKIVAPPTPIGKLTESLTVSGRVTLQEEVISPFGDRNSPPTDLGPTVSWMRGAIATLAKPGAAGVIPARCFHIQCPMPPQRKMWLSVFLSVAEHKQRQQLKPQAYLYMFVHDT